MRILFFILLFVCFATSVYSQKYYDLNPIKMNYVEEDHKQEGISFTQKEEIKVRSVGSDDTLVLKNLKFSNTSFLEARLTFDLHVCGKTSGRYDTSAGDYFVTIAFFDANKNCLLSSSFVSNGHFSLAGAPMNKYSNPSLVRKYTTADCFQFSGDTQVPIHQAFFYSDEEGAAGIKPIKSFTITIFHLGAG